MQLMPDSPVRRAALEVESHVAVDGWDQPARLFALVSSADLVTREPELAESLKVEPHGFTPIEQELPADGREIEDLLTEIGWPDTVIGCVVVVERVMLPADAEESLPDDPEAMLAAAATHPDRREVRLVAAVTRGGAVHSALRVRMHSTLRLETHSAVGARTDDDATAELLEGPDLVPGLVARLKQTLEP